MVMRGLLTARRDAARVSPFVRDFDVSRILVDSWERVVVVASPIAAAIVFTTVPRRYGGRGKVIRNEKVRRDLDFKISQSIKISSSLSSAAIINFTSIKC